MQSSNKIVFADRPTCTIRQAAEATGLSRSTLYQRISVETATAAPSGAELRIEAGELGCAREG
jgi:predicted DNA-binding transcriptional regulator AlpA